MLRVRDNIWQSMDSLRAHKLRTSLTILGIMMGVATLITVMTLVQGANVYVESKIANLGTDVFQIQRTPFTITDFNLIIKSLRYKRVEMDDVHAVGDACRDCLYVGAQASASTRSAWGDRHLPDTNLIGQTASMVNIDTRTIALGRYFTEVEDQRSAHVCLIGQRLVDEFFPGLNPIGRTVRLADQEFSVVGTYEAIGAILGQEQDNYAIIPMNTWRKMRGAHFSVTINVKASSAPGGFERAQDEARLVLRARRHVPAKQDDDFFIGTKDSYIDLWKKISSAFFAVFVMVSSISAVVGGVVIMNVMLVSVTERTKEIGIRRAVGATQDDILRQFLSESVTQCVAGGIAGVLAGFGVALLLARFTSFPAAVKGWVVVLGIVTSSAIGLFFGIYPATRAARLDPVVALRTD